MEVTRFSTERARKPEQRFLSCCATEPGQPFLFGASHARAANDLLLCDHVFTLFNHFPGDICRRPTVLNGSYLPSLRRIANCERSMSPSLQAATTILAALSIRSIAPT